MQHTKKRSEISDRFFVLSYLYSNQDKQNQNLLCYHYTIGQSSFAYAFGLKRCKDITLW